MHLQSLKAPYLAPGWPGSIWNSLRAPVRSTGVSGMFVCGFQTDEHCGNALRKASCGLRRNVPSAWSSLKLGVRQSTFRSSEKPSNSIQSILDIQR